MQLKTVFLKYSLLFKNDYRFLIHTSFANSNTLIIFIHYTSFSPHMRTTRMETLKKHLNHIHKKELVENMVVLTKN